METNEHSVQFAGGTLGRQRHICAFFNSINEQYHNYVVPKYDNAVICAYDLSKFGATVVMDGLRTHPVVIIGGLLQENSFFVSPDQFLLEIRERRSLGKSARMSN